MNNRKPFAVGKKSNLKTTEMRVFAKSGRSFGTTVSEVRRQTDTRRSLYRKGAPQRGRWRRLVLLCCPQSHSSTRWGAMVVRSCPPHQCRHSCSIFDLAYRHTSIPPLFPFNNPALRRRHHPKSSLSSNHDITGQSPVPANSVRYARTYLIPNIGIYPIPNCHARNWLFLIELSIFDNQRNLKFRRLHYKFGDCR